MRYETKKRKLRKSDIILYAEERGFKELFLLIIGILKAEKKEKKNI